MVINLKLSKNHFHKTFFFNLSQVLLLESGDEEPIVSDVPALRPYLLKSNIDYAYHTQPDAQTLNKSHYWARGKVLGGTSVINTIWYIRGILILII